MVWDFVEEQHIKIGFKEQDSPTTIYPQPAPPTGGTPDFDTMPKGLKINTPSGAAHQGVMAEAKGRPSEAANATNTTEADTSANHDPSATNPSESSKTPENNFDWRKLLGNSQEGPISKLRAANQQIVTQLLAGQYGAILWEQVSPLIQVEQWQTNLEEGWQSWSDKASTSTDHTLGELLSSLVNWILTMINEALEQFRQLLQQIWTWLHQLATALWELIKKIEVPGETLPSKILKDFLNGWSTDEQPPHIILVILALPVSITKDFLDLSVEEINEWIKS